MTDSGSATPDPVFPGEPPLNGVMARNIRALLEQRREAERRQQAQEKIAEAIGRFTGSMRFVYLHLALFGIWIGANLGWIPFLPRFDRTFVVLAMFASVEAIFLSTFVLINQNRMGRLADRRADLDVQISLLTEHEITQLVELVSEMAKRMGIEQAQSEEIEHAKRDVRPEDVLRAIEHEEDESKPGPE